jgi:hypothetical protein
MVDVQQLLRYLNTKLDHLHETNTDVEAHLSRERDIMLKGNLTKEEKDEVKRYYNYVVGNTFRQVMFIAACAFLEEVMKIIAKNVVPDYPKKRLKGNIFERPVEALRQGGVSFAKIEKECQRLSDLVEVRHCIVHTGAKVEDYHNERVTEAVERYDFLGPFKDGFLCLGEGAVSTVLGDTRAMIAQLEEHLPSGGQS